MRASCAELHNGQVDRWKPFSILVRSDFADMPFREEAHRASGMLNLPNDSRHLSAKNISRTQMGRQFVTKNSQALARNHHEICQISPDLLDQMCPAMIRFFLHAQTLPFSTSLN